MLSGGARRMVRAWTVLVLVFLYAPLLLVVVNAFNTSRTFAFPPTGFTWAWWVDAWNSEGMWKSLVNSVVVGLGATAIALFNAPPAPRWHVDRVPSRRAGPPESWPRESHRL